jgi:hypothetical protein
MAGYPFWFGTLLYIKKKEKSPEWKSVPVRSLIKLISIHITIEGRVYVLERGYLLVKLLTVLVEMMLSK